MRDIHTKFLDRLTPRKAAALVALYGVQMHFHRRHYVHDAVYKKIVYRSFFNALVLPQKSAWVTILVPSEMLIALGLTPLMLETLGGVMGSQGLAGHFLKNSDEIGVPPSLCTFHRTHLAAALKSILPKPRLVVAASALCDGNLRSLQEISYSLDSPFIFIDIPEPTSPGAIDYVRDQLEHHFFRIAERLKIKNPVERLKKTLAVSEETRKWMEVLNKSREKLYIPQKPMGFVWNLLLHTSQLGDGRTLRYYKTLCQELRKKGMEISQDKTRFLLMHLLPAYKHRALEILKQRNGVIAMEETSHISWPQIDLQKPFSSMAKKILLQPMLGNAERRIKEINYLCERYNIDGIIHFSHWGCRLSSGSLNAIKRYLKRPIIDCETDLVDPQSSSAGQIATRMEGFLEMLERNHAPNLGFG
ncbi:MAG: 2-hydroxyacyl-CoA dehydratase subunit D [Acidobacteriota bacterium]